MFDCVFDQIKKIDPPQTLIRVVGTGFSMIIHKLLHLVNKLLTLNFFNLVSTSHCFANLTAKISVVRPFKRNKLQQFIIICLVTMICQL